jgi:hypothetical protein
MPEDPAMVAAMTRGEGTLAVVSGIEQLAIDCGELSVALYAVARQRIETLTGHTQSDMVRSLQAIDLDTVDDPRVREQVEAARATSELDLSSVNVTSPCRLAH